MYQVRTAYRMESRYIIVMAVRRLKSSSSRGLDTRFIHWIPTPCSSNRAKYSQPNPNATGDSRLCGGRENVTQSVQSPHSIVTKNSKMAGSLTANTLAPKPM